MESALRQGGRDPSVKLIETLAWDGTRAVRAARHLARLARSAALLGWHCDPAAAEAALLRGRVGPARLRLTLDRTGRIEVTESVLVPFSGPVRLGLAGARLAAGDPWLGVKTTRRATYDRARAELPAGFDEVIFLNGADEVCDGTITTVFFDAGHGLRTPPLRCGLLPGVLREEMLATGQAQEAVLLAADLPRVRLWVGNSLRGLGPAVWIG